MLTKKCSKCGKRKRLAQFTAVKQGAGGVRGDCKACRAEIGGKAWKERYHNDPEFRRQQISRITEANRRRRRAVATSKGSKTT